CPPEPPRTSATGAADPRHPGALPAGQITLTASPHRHTVQGSLPRAQRDPVFRVKLNGIVFTQGSARALLPSGSEYHRPFGISAVLVMGAQLAVEFRTLAPGCGDFPP